jgi:hypothetical protein
MWAEVTFSRGGWHLRRLNETTHGNQSAATAYNHFVRWSTRSTLSPAMPSALAMVVAPARDTRQNHFQ